MKSPSLSGASKIVINRTDEKIEVIIHTSRPGLVIGKKGEDIEALKKGLSKKFNKPIWLEVYEIRRPGLDARLVAETIGSQLVRRAAFRRAMKKALQATLAAGARGVKIAVSGRLGGAEIARTEWYQEGSVPLHTLKADIQYASVAVETTFGVLGIKTWIHTQDKAS